MRFSKLALAALLVSAVSTTQAQSFFTPVNSTTGGGSVDAKADFTASNGQITLILTNLLQNPGADSQLINGITFTVSGASSSGLLLTSNSGEISTISAGGAYTAGSSDSLARWEATETAETIALTTLSGGTPNRLIIGADSKGNFDPSLGGKYLNANSSITKNHNPNVLGTATFTLTASGVTSASQFSHVVFNFGTAAGSNTVAGTMSRATPALTPEPGNIALVVGMSLSGAGFLVRRRRSH